MTTFLVINGDSPCPHDDRFEHRFYFGCVPKTFSDRTGRAKGFRQTETPNAYPKVNHGVTCASTRWLWNGGCDAHFQPIHEGGTA